MSSNVSAFVPGFEWDVFISYSHVDDLVLTGGPESGWVHIFKDNLQRLLARKLRGTGRGRVWIDRRLSGNEPFDEKIGQAVSHSATLLVILSEGYLESDWCRRERELFAEAAQGSGGHQGRIFAVRMTDVNHGLWPPELGSQIGYKFFRKENEEAAAHPLGFPVPDPMNPADRPYFDRLDDMVCELGDQLKRMVEQPTTGDPGSLKLRVDAEVQTGSDQPTIFLAEATVDLEELRENFQRHLSQLGLRTLPGTYYQRAPDSFRSALEKDLTGSLLFVQLLGPYASHKSQDLPKGYEGLQLDSALALEKPIMRWHDPELDLDKVRDRDLLEREDVMVMPFEDFKREVIQRVTRLSVQREHPVCEGDAFVLLAACAADEEAAVRMGEILSEQHAIGFDIATEQDSLPDLVEEDDYDGLMVVYGQCEQSWVQTQIRKCRRILLRKKDRAPVGAIFVDPLPDGYKEPVKTRPARFYMFSRPDEAAFQKFVSAIQARSPE